MKETSSMKYLRFTTITSGYNLGDDIRRGTAVVRADAITLIAPDTYEEQTKDWTWLTVEGHQFCVDHPYGEVMYRIGTALGFDDA